MLKLKGFLFLCFMLFCISVSGQNKITLRFISLGGDGFKIMPGCELLYSRKLSHGLDFRIGYTQASKNIQLNNSFVSRNKDAVMVNLLSQANDSDNPTVEYTHYVSYNLGIAKIINSSIRSDITLYLGVRYENLNRLSFISTGSQVESIKTLSKKNKGISPELEISYNYRISQSVGVSAGFNYSNANSIYSGSIGGRVYF